MPNEKLTNGNMEAQISELWETGIQIISAAGDNFDENRDGFCGDEITSFADLRKCKNVLVGKKEKGLPSYAPTEVMINDEIVYVSFRSYSHPTGCGKVRVCEIN